MPVMFPPTSPDALTESFAFVFANVPVTVVVPLAADVSLAFVLANVPVTVVVPLAELLSFAFVLASVPVTVVVPVAALVSLALVVASVPDTPPPAAAGTHIVRWRGWNSCQTDWGSFVRSVSKPSLKISLGDCAKRYCLCG